MEQIAHVTHAEAYTGNILYMWLGSCYSASSTFRGQVLKQPTIGIE